MNPSRGRAWPTRLKVAVFVLLVLLLGWLLSEVFYSSDQQWNQSFSLRGSGASAVLGFALFGQPVADLLVAGARALILCGGLSVLLCAMVALGVGYFLSVLAPSSLASRSMVFVLDVFGAVPGFLLSMVVLYAMGPSRYSLVLAFAVANWDAPSRLAWSLGRLVVSRPAYLADVALGYPSQKLFWGHYLPEVFGPLSAKICSLLAGFIVFGASAVVIGVLDPQFFPWGALIDQGRHYFDVAPHLLIAGWALIFVSTFILTLISSGIHLLFEGKNPR